MNAGNLKDFNRLIFVEMFFSNSWGYGNSFIIHVKRARTQNAFHNIWWIKGDKTIPANEKIMDDMLKIRTTVVQFHFINRLRCQYLCSESIMQMND